MRDGLRILCSRPLSIGCVSWPSGRLTLIVKLTLEPTSEGALVLAAQQHTTALDRTGAHGEVVVPGDFAPFKPRCDVLVIERDAAARASAGVLVVGDTRFEAGERESFGARSLFCPRGDPTDPASEALWSEPGADFVRFQSAEPQRRLPYPTSPLDVELRRGAASLRWRFTGPLPRGYQLTTDGAAIRHGVPLALDTVLVDPEESRLVVVFRGVVSSPSDGALVVDASWDRTLDLARVWAFVPVAPVWPRSAAALAPASSPARQREAAGPHAEETRALLTRGPLGPALPFGPQPAPPLGLEPTVASSSGASSSRAPIDETRASAVDEVTAPLGRSRAETLPFARTGGPSVPRRSLSAEELAELREGDAVVSSPWGQDETRALGGQAAIVAPPLVAPAPVARADAGAIAPSPFGPSALGGLALRSDPAPTPAALPTNAGPSTEEAPRDLEPPARVAPAVAAVLPSDPAPNDEAARVAAIQRDVWKATEPLADILARHGLTESSWRDLKKRAKART